MNALIPRRSLLRDEAVSLLQGVLTASLRRVRSSHRHISGITPQPFPDMPTTQHPASSSRPLCDRHSAGSASPPLPRCRPRRTRSLRSLACHRARLGPSGNAHPVGSVAAAEETAAGKAVRRHPYKTEERQLTPPLFHTSQFAQLTIRNILPSYYKLTIYTKNNRLLHIIHISLGISQPQAQCIYYEFYGRYQLTCCFQSPNLILQRIALWHYWFIHVFSI